MKKRTVVMFAVTLAAIGLVGGGYYFIINRSKNQSHALPYLGVLQVSLQISEGGQPALGTVLLASETPATENGSMEVGLQNGHGSFVVGNGTEMPQISELTFHSFITDKNFSLPLHPFSGEEESMAVPMSSSLLLRADISADGAVTLFQTVNGVEQDITTTGLVVN